MKILGLWSGHDCSYSLIENGKPIVHDEYERFIREKEPAGDSASFAIENLGDDIENISHVATVFPHSKLSNYKDSFDKIKTIIEKNNGKIYAIGHHQAHAANAFFSSNIKESMIITIEGGGIESNGSSTACTIWEGKDNNINLLHQFHQNEFNIGGIWTRATRYIFNLQSGWPRGHQAGTVMAMAAMGDSKKYHDDFYKMLTIDNFVASQKPKGQPRGPNTGEDPPHPYLQKWREIADTGDQETFDLAAGLQAATETMFKQLLQSLILQIPFKNLCLSGGVALNSVMVGKIRDWFPEIENVYVTPVPHDGGLTIGASQYVWHQVLENPRIEWKDSFTPYLGKTYKEEEIFESLRSFKEKIDIHTNILQEDIVELLDSQSIVSVFGGGSESGRRALGNRSILCDPRDPNMKDTINEKVKHRQSFRPFAPSILKEEVKNWFTEDIDSPYMSFVLQFKEEAKEKVPAVVHLDGSARLQTVTSNDNDWYHRLLKKWHSVSSVPILLNTSFNDREPICENPTHAIDCFLRTDIDYLYFYDYNILISKKDTPGYNKNILQNQEELSENS